MRIGIVGGTGGMGEGFAIRWCYSHDIIIGSRELNKANEAADNYTKAAKEIYGDSMTGTIRGGDNITLGKDCDVLILSIPYEYISDTCGKIAPNIKEECIVVSPIVPMTRSDNGFIYIPLEQKKDTAAELVAKHLPPRARIVSAFHTISEIKLKNAKQSLDADTFVCGDDSNRVGTINNLVQEINGLRSIYLGPLSLSYQAEILTPMLLNAAKRNKMKHPGLRLV